MQTSEQRGTTRPAEPTRSPQSTFQFVSVMPASITLQVEVVDPQSLVDRALEAKASDNRHLAPREVQGALLRKSLSMHALVDSNASHGFAILWAAESKEDSKASLLEEAAKSATLTHAPQGRKWKHAILISSQDLRRKIVTIHDIAD